MSTTAPTHVTVATAALAPGDVVLTAGFSSSPNDALPQLDIRRGGQWRTIAIVAPVGGTAIQLMFHDGRLLTVDTDIQWLVRA